LGNAARVSAESALRDELGSIVNSETLVVLAGSGSFLGIAANPDRQCPKLDPRPKRLPPHPTATGRTDARRMGLVRRMVSGT
jgi:hypothetical protein